jgi:nucleoside-diphosphate-sugar epimerase
MRVFITGASGWIGSATITELLSAGHQAVGLARSDTSAMIVEKAGAEVLRGDLADLDALRAGAAGADAVIHLAFNHDFSDMAGAARADRRAIDVFGDVLEGSDRPLLIASGTLGLSPGNIGTERDMPDPAVHPRTANAAATLALAERGVRSMVVRFALTVHGAGDYAFLSTLVDIARAKGVSAYIDDGANRWPAVHRSDAARLVHMAIENAPPASMLHAVAEEAVPTREIAEAVGRSLGLPVVSVPRAEARDHFGLISGFFAADAPASSAITRDLLGWTPTGPTLAEDLGSGTYFASTVAP